MSYHHGNLRQALLETAERLLEQDGPNAVTLRAIARAVGVSHAAPKNHFGSLPGLLSALAASGMERLAAAARAAVADDPEGRMHAFGAAYVRFALDHPNLFGLMFRTERLDRGSAALLTASRSLLDLLAAESGAAGDAIAPETAQQMALAWAQVHGLAVLLLEDRLDPLVARIASGMDRATFAEALLAPAGRPPAR